MSSVRNLKLEVILSAIDKATRPIKAVMGSSQGLSKQLKETKDRLKELNQAQVGITAFRSLTKDAKETGEKLAGARQKLKQMQEQMAAIGPPTEAMTRKLKSAEIAVEKLTLANRKKVDAAKAAKTALEANGISTARLGQHELELAGKIDSTSAAMRRQEAMLKRLSDRQNQHRANRANYERGMETRDRVAGAGAGMMATGATTAAAVTVPINAYAQAEDAAMQLRVAMMERGNRVKPAFEAINALAERLGNKLPGTTAELQDMMTMLNRQGMSAKAILGGVGEASAYLGVQLKLPYTQAAEYAAKMQDATGALEKDMMGVMDTIQRTYQVGVDPSNMVAGFAKLSPVLDMIKQKGLEGAKTMAPLLAMADQASLVGESAGNAYRKVFQRSMDAKKIAKGNQVAKNAGVKLDFTNGKGEFGGLDKMFNQLAQLKKLNTQQRNRVIAEIWGDDAETLQALNVMIDKGQAGYREMQQKMADQASLQERVNAQLGTLKNLWDAASGTFTNAMVRFGEAIAPELKALTQWIGDISERLGSWAKENPNLANTLMKIAGISAIVLTALGGLALAIAGVIGPFLMAKFALTALGITLGSGAGALGILANGFNLVMKSIGLVGNVMMWLGRVFLMNPIGLVITTIAVGAYLIWRNWDTLGPKFAALWASIKQAFATGWEWIKTNASAAFSWFLSLPGRFTTLGSQIMQGLVSGITSGLANVKNAIVSAGDSTIGWFKEKLGIHSPSRVFAELGGFTMAGLHQGITNNQGGPLGAVMSVAKKLTAAGAGLALTAGTAMAGSVPIDNRAPITAQRGAPAASAAPQFNITIQAAPGMNEQMLAQLVAREVERIQRQTAARGRSRLTDKD